MGLNYKGSGTWTNLISGSQVQTQPQQSQKISLEQPVVSQQKVVAPKAPKK